MWTSFIRLLNAPIVLFENDLRLGDGEFIIFAAHRFDEDGEVEFATAADTSGIIAVTLFNF